jgi:hypothetical protein
LDGGQCRQAGWLAFLVLGMAAARLRARPPLRAALLALQLTLLFFYLANRRFLVWYSVWIVPPLALCAFAPRWWRASVAFTLGSPCHQCLPADGFDRRRLAPVGLAGDLPAGVGRYSAARQAPDPTTSSPAV